MGRSYRPLRARRRKCPCLQQGGCGTRHARLGRHIDDAGPGERPIPLTIVVADDAPDYREMVRALLRPMSDTVTIVREAADGEEALALVRRERPDIVITDL